MGGVGVYAYRAIAASTHAQLTRELTTILQADIEALRLWMGSQKALARGEAATADLLGPTQALREIVRSAEDLGSELLNAEAARAGRDVL